MKLTGKKKKKKTETGISGNVSMCQYSYIYRKLYRKFKFHYKEKNILNLSRKKWDYLRMKELEENT